MAIGAKQGGASLDAAKLEAAYTGFHARFFKELANQPLIYERIASVITDDRPVSVYNWITNVPKMRKWIGNKRLHKLRAQKHEIRTEPYEASIQIPKQDIIDDRFGLWSEKIGQMAEAYPRAIDQGVVEWLMGGISAETYGRTYDNQYLIDTDHTADGSGSGTAQSNLVPGALTATTYRTAYKRMAYEFLDDVGEPVYNTPRTLLVGVANADVARDIVQRQWIAGIGGGTAGANVQVENLERATVDVIVSPRITGTQWFVLAANPTAVVVQRKRGPDFYSVDDQGGARGSSNPHTFMTGTYLYGIEAELGYAYGAWQDVVGGPGV